MPSPSDDSGIEVWPIAGEHARMLDAIAASLAVARANIPMADELPASIDIAAAEDPDTRALAITARLVAEQLVAELAAGTQPAPSQAEPGTLGAIDAALGMPPIRMNRKRLEAALPDVAALIREIGLERHDLDCYLGTGPDGGPVIAAAPVPPATAYVWLLGRLFERAEMLVLSDPFLMLERQASAWYFERWSAVTRLQGADDGGFARAVREQEWSLVARDTLSLEEPVMMTLIDDDAFSEMAPRQRYLAHALQQSVVDVFEITAVDGAYMTARSVRDGRTYRVHEHNEEAEPIPGLLLLGRLIPLDDDVWLRSPGALLFSPLDDGQAAVLAEGLTLLGESMPTPLAIEAFISTIAYAARVPVSRKPAPSANAAREMLAALYEAMEDLGLQEDVPADEAPPELVQAATPGAQIVGFSLDQVMAEWAAALTEQAKGGSRGRTAAGKSKKKTTTKPKRKPRGKQQRGQ